MASANTLPRTETVALAASKRVYFWQNPAWNKWLGPCASLVCLAHCFTLPVILLLAPGVFHVVPYQFLHELELVFWIAAVELGSYTLRNASISLTWQRAFVALALLAPIAVVMGQAALAHAVFLAMALLQFALVFITHIRATQEAPICCEGHEHS